MQSVILILHVVVCVLLVILVLLQAGKEGMGVIFGGGGGSMFGATGAGGILVKLTTFLAVIFIGTSLGYNIMTSSSKKVEKSVLDVQFEESIPAPTPPVPVSNTVKPAETPKSDTVSTTPPEAPKADATVTKPAEAAKTDSTAEKSGSEGAKPGDITITVEVPAKPAEEPKDEKSANPDKAQKTEASPTPAEGSKADVPADKAPENQSQNNPEN